MADQEGMVAFFTGTSLDLVHKVAMHMVARGYIFKAKCPSATYKKKLTSVFSGVFTKSAKAWIALSSHSDCQEVTDSLNAMGNGRCVATFRPPARMLSVQESSDALVLYISVSQESLSLLWLTWPTLKTKPKRFGRLSVLSARSTMVKRLQCSSPRLSCSYKYARGDAVL
jgi:hypothetical protein